MNKILKLIKRYGLNKWHFIAFFTVGAFLMIGVLSQSNKSSEKITGSPGPKTFNGGRVIATGRSLEKVRDESLRKSIELLQANQEGLAGKLEALRQIIEAFNAEKKIDLHYKSEGKSSEETKPNIPDPVNQDYTVPKTQRVKPTGGAHLNEVKPPGGSAARGPGLKGPSVISFPIQSEPGAKRKIHISSGSYIETVLLSGVQATNGKPYPVLLKATQSFVGPNKTKVDLSGCFILGKALGNLNLGRVEIMPYKLACTSKSGELFERDLKGFVADKDDNSFGIKGEVDLNVGSRLAALTFLSSMIEGISGNIERLQTRQTATSSLGGSSTSTNIVGDEGRYMAAGGASQAANTITKYFLDHASGFMPTINVHSSQKLYVIVQESVELPAWYFRKNKKGQKNDYLYVTRLLD